MQKITTKLRIIATCGCSDTDKFAVDAFKLLFPDEEVPIVVHSFITRNSTLRRYLSALLKRTDAYAEYIEVDGDYLTAWDLLKGIKVC